MAEKFSVQAVFTAVDHFSGPVARMSDTLNKFNGKGGVGGAKGPKLGAQLYEASAAMGRMGDRARSVGNMVTGIGIAGAFAAHKLVTVGADVESALLAGSSKFGDGIRRNTPAFKELESAAFDLGKTTKFGAVEAAGALNELAASGFSPAAAMKNLPIMAQMAIAGGEELQMASNIALDSMGAFGMLYDEMGQLRGPEQLAANLTRVADVMAYTANQTTASMGSIYESLTEAGPITKVAGMTFEKFAAITGALSQAGIKGSSAGTAIKNISVRLLSPTTEGSKELRKLKIDEKSFRKMTDPLEQLEVIAKAIDTLPKEDKIKALDEYFGKIPLAGASFLANGGFRNARVLEENIINNSAGSNAKQAEIIADSTDTKMALLKNKFEDLGKTIFNEIQKPLEDSISKAVEYLNKNQGKFAQQANGAVEWVGNHGDEIGTAAEWGLKAWLFSIGAGLVHSTVQLAGDLGKMGTAIGVAGAALWKFPGQLASGISTLTMGRVALGAATGFTGLATGGVSLAAQLVGGYYNDDTKGMTEGLGTWDLITKAFQNTYNGDTRGVMGVIDDHQNAIAKRERQRRLMRDMSDAPDTAFDAALANSQYGDLSNPNPNDGIMATLLSEFSQNLQMEPVEIPKEAITVKPVDAQAVFDAIAAQIASSGPQVVGTEDKNAGANQDYFGIHNQTDAVVTVQAEPGTKARTSRSTHTKPNNHRTGTN
jgi:TP901 family phage tail tape measure protein